jgi:predicted transcriptional regulator
MTLTEEQIAALVTLCAKSRLTVSQRVYSITNRNVKALLKEGIIEWDPSRWGGYCLTQKGKKEKADFIKKNLPTD